MERDFELQAGTIVYVTEKKPFAAAAAAPGIALKIINKKDCIENGNYKRSNYRC